MNRLRILAIGSVVGMVTGMPGGTIGFANDPFSLGYEPPIYDADGQPLEGTAYLAQLYAGASANQLGPIGQPVSFLTASFVGYSRSGTRKVPTVSPGTAAVVRVRAGEASAGETYEEAAASGSGVGESDLMTVVTGGFGTPPSLPINMVAFESFIVGPDDTPSPRPPPPPPVRITRHPERQTVLASNAVTFAVEADGIGVLFYQWLHNGVGIVGTSGPVLEISDVQLTDGGTYQVIVSGPRGWTTSREATLVVRVSGGTINFANDPPSLGYEAPIYDADGQPLEGTAYLAELYAGASANQLGPVGPPVSFLTGSFAGYFRGGTREVPTVSPGAPAVVRVRAWEASAGETYEEALANGGGVGESDLFRVVTGGSGSPPSLPANMLSFGGFRVVPAPPVRITLHPESQTVPLGTDVSFTVQAQGEEPLSYQWRRNGANIVGANGPKLDIIDAQPAEGGTYQVVVANDLGLAVSDKALLKVTDDEGSFELYDSFLRSLEGPDVSSTSGSAFGNNEGATFEADDGERPHGGIPGTNSVWLTWRSPPGEGWVKFSTKGSSFDTVLAVYTTADSKRAEGLDALVPLASDDDRNNNIDQPLEQRLSVPELEEQLQSFYNSTVVVKTSDDELLYVAVTGYFNAAGEVLLSWDFKELQGDPSEERVPWIIQHPLSVIVKPGADAEFRIDAENAYMFRWYHNEELLLEDFVETSSTYTVVGAGRDDVGIYFAEVEDQFGNLIRSRVARLEIGTEARPDTRTQDKLKELERQTGGQPGLFNLAPDKARPKQVSPSPGIPGWKLLSNIHAGMEIDDPDLNAVITGHTMFFELETASLGGTLLLETAGSDRDLGLQLGAYEGVDLRFGRELNSAYLSDVIQTGRLNASESAPTSTGDAYLRVPLQANQRYTLEVAGVPEEEGTLRLNYVLLAGAQDLSVIPVLTDDSSGVEPGREILITHEGTGTQYEWSYQDLGGGAAPAAQAARGGLKAEWIPIPWASGGASLSTNAWQSRKYQVVVDGLATYAVEVQVDPDRNAFGGLPSIGGLQKTRTIEEDGSATLQFTVSDVETAAEDLSVLVTSSDQTLLPQTGIVLGGSGTERSLTLTPAKDEWGQATLTITVTDADGLPASDTVQFTVTEVNDLPGFHLSSTIVTADENSPARTVKNFAVDISPGADNESGQSLTFRLEDISPGLFEIVPTVDSTTGALSFKPMSNASGTNTIRIQLSDNGTPAASSPFRKFDIRIAAGNALSPTIQVRRDGLNFVLEFVGRLVSSDSATGLFTNVLEAVSPYTIKPTPIEPTTIEPTGKARFYRAVIE